MKYVFVESAATTGGGKRILSYILKYSKKGVESYVILNRGGPLVEEFEKYSSVFVLDEIRNARIINRLVRKLQRFEHRIGFLRYISKKLINIKEKHKAREGLKIVSAIVPDVIVRACNSRNEPLSVIHFDSTVMVQHLMQPAMALYRKKEWELEWIKGADVFVCEGEGMRTVATDYLGIKDTQIKINCIGVDSERKEVTSPIEEKEVKRVVDGNEFMVLTCSSLIYSKGVDLWLRAAIRVLDENPEEPIKFIWVGGRTRDFENLYGKAIRYQLAQSGHKDKICFVGQKMNVFPWLRRCDMFVQPSRDDAFPHAIMEAMLVGKPSICFPIGIGAEEYAKDAIYLVDKISSIELAKAIIDLYRNQNLRNQIADRGIDLMKKKFEIESTVMEYWNILDGAHAEKQKDQQL